MTDEYVYKYQALKYQIFRDDWITIEMPLDAIPLHFEFQESQLTLWARVRPNNPMTNHRFRILGVGHVLGTNVGKYVNTFFEGDLIFHAFAEEMNHV